MRESQSVIFAGPLGSTILQHDEFHIAPTKVINLEVALWRLGKRPHNPRSARNTDDLTYRFQDSAILNETNNNEYRADHPPESIERRRQRRQQWSGVQTPSGSPFITPDIYRRQRRQHVASPGMLGPDTVGVYSDRINAAGSVERRYTRDIADATRLSVAAMRAADARENEIRAALRLARIADEEQHNV